MDKTIFFRSFLKFFQIPYTFLQISLIGNSICNDKCCQKFTVLASRGISVWEKIMGHTIASLSQDKTSSRGDYLIITSCLCHWAQTIKQDPRFPNLENVVILSCPLIVNKTQFLAPVEEVLRTKPEAHWKVIFAPPLMVETMGGSLWTPMVVIMASPIGGTVGFISSLCTPLAFGGYISTRGRYLETLNLGKRGADDDSPMIVTGWARELWQYDEVGHTVTSDDYVFRGIPRCAAMRKGQKPSFNSIVEIAVTQDGVIFKRDWARKKR